MGFNDLALDWGQDFSISAQCDLQTATDLPLLKQRVIRRILTNKKDLIFEPLFGVGIPQYVSDGISPSIFNEIKQRVIEEIYKEETIARDPAPEIEINGTYNAIFISLVIYTVDSNQVALQFEVSR
jgi:hypothetical protein